MPNQLRFVPLSNDTIDDFMEFHASECEFGPCYCMFWWTDPLEWERLSWEDTLRMRQKLISSDVFDGYLLYSGTEVVAWCQCYPRDSFPAIRKRFGLELENGVWAITCFLVKKGLRHQGIMTLMLDNVLVDLKSRGADAVESYPRTLDSFDEMHAWNGVEKTYVEKGFAFVKSMDGRSVYRYDF